MDLHGNLLGPEPTKLPERTESAAALANGADPADVVRIDPSASAAWAALAELALSADEPVAAYAYARTGYHRGLDQLRRAGWKGHGPIPWSHVPNQGFLRALAALTKAADLINDEEEAVRCRNFLVDSDPAAAAELGLG
ncbi:DUF3151 domain-containing protein [Pseudonocardiaceae bacterium YIM PH 21723]|nr:DUF3151 domain-containing protein [Pseudonocardiaceae bacterium YIM PH 21723]